MKYIKFVSLQDQKTTMNYNDGLKYGELQVKWNFYNKLKFYHRFTNNLKGKLAITGIYVIGTANVYWWCLFIDETYTIINRHLIHTASSYFTSPHLLLKDKQVK